MVRKGRWLVVATCVVVLGFFMQNWIVDRQSESESVGWSPLYDNRVTEALVPVTSQVVRAQGGSLAAPCPTPTLRDCEPDTQDKACIEPTFESTCEGARTCEGYEGFNATADCATCDGHPDCGNGGTVAGAVCTYEGEACTYDGPGCDGGTWAAPLCTWDAPFCTWDGPECEGKTLHPWKCGGPTSRYTCIAGGIDGVLILDDAMLSEPMLERLPCVPGPTYEGRTCVRPTCDGPTCEGLTCYEEDCEFWDFGDAPDFADSPFHYGTTIENDGARHRFFGLYFLGRWTDPDIDGRPNVTATGDDQPEWTARDDEDGVWFVTTLVPGEPAVAIVQASRSGSLTGWLDYDLSGRWDRPEERLFEEEAIRLEPGFNWVTFVVPEDAVPEVSYARFRFGSGGSPDPHGEAMNGEVEDYQFPICARYSAWVMTDHVYYGAGDEMRVRLYLNETSQVTLVRHLPDGGDEYLWRGTLEAGRHEFPGEGRSFFIEPAFGTTTVELIATSLQSGCTSWLSTPYSVVLP